jgi:CRISPR/Cas system-associated endonuclease Cas1
MLHLTVSDEYAQLISEAKLPVVFVDSKGKPLGQLSPVDPSTATLPAITAEELAELKRRKSAALRGEGNFITTSELLRELRELAPE